MSDHDPFHEGERAVQLRVGERAMGVRNGALITTEIVAGARPFLARQPLIVLAAADRAQALWVSLWFGPPGFVRGDDGRVVTIRGASTAAGDPLVPALSEGTPVALLAIDLATRRRLRINGEVATHDGRALSVTVRESFPNCPKYIQRRSVRAGAAAATEPASQGERLDPERTESLRRVSTCFVGSRHPRAGVDVSHRGGEPGFVHVLDERTLRFPDYAGNGMFQTLGNLEVDPHAAVTAIDFDRRRILAMTGVARATFGGELAGHPTGGTGRYWLFELARWVELPIPVPFVWSEPESSPFNPPPGGSGS